MNKEAMEWNDFTKQWEACQKRITQHKSFFKWSVIGFKSFDTDDGFAFSCKLVFMGVVVGTAKNSGTGGPDHIRFDKPLEGEAKTSWEEMEAIAKEVSQYEPEALVLDSILKKCGK